MIKWFLFNWIDAKTAGTAVCGQYDLLILAGTDKAEATLALMQFAVAGTQVTLNSAVFENVPVLGGNNIWICHHSFCFALESTVNQESLYLVFSELHQSRMNNRDG